MAGKLRLAQGRVGSLYTGLGKEEVLRHLPSCLRTKDAHVSSALVSGSFCVPGTGNTEGKPYVLARGGRNAR